MSDLKIRVIAPDGTPGTIPYGNLEKALQQGYKQAGSEGGPATSEGPGFVERGQQALSDVATRAQHILTGAQAGMLGRIPTDPSFLQAEGLSSAQQRKFRAWQEKQDWEGKEDPGIASLLAARAFQALPGAESPEAQNLYESLPVQRTANRLGNVVGDIPAAILQAGGQIAPQIAMMQTLPATGARLAGEAVGEAGPLVRAVARAVGGGAQNLGVAAGWSAASAPLGQRAGAFGAGLKDPLNLAMSFGPAALHALPELRSAREQVRQMPPLSDEELQRKLALVKQTLSQKVDTSPAATERTFVPTNPKVNPEQVIGEKTSTGTVPYGMPPAPADILQEPPISREPGTNPGSPKRQGKGQLPPEAVQSDIQAPGRARVAAMKAEYEAKVAAGEVKPSAAFIPGGTMEARIIPAEQLARLKGSEVMDLLQRERSDMEAKHPGHFEEDPTVIRDRSAALLAASRGQGLMDPRTEAAARLAQAKIEAGLPKTARDVLPTNPGGEATPSTPVELDLRRPQPRAQPPPVEGGPGMSQEQPMGPGVKLRKKRPLIGGGAGSEGERWLQGGIHGLELERGNQLHLDPATVDPRTQPITRPPIDVTSPPPPVPPHVVNALTQAGQSIAKRGQQFMDRATKELSLPENRAAPEAAYAIRQANAAMQMNDHAAKVVHPLLKDSLKGVNEKAVGRVMAALRDLKVPADEAGQAAVQAKAVALEAQLPESFKANFSKYKDAHQHMVGTLINEGWFSPAEAAAVQRKLDLGIPYLHREYLAILDKRWEPPKEVMSSTVAKLMEKQPSLTEQEATAHLDAFVKNFMEASPTDRRSVFAKSNLSRSILKQRTMPTWLRPVLGVIDDPSFMVAQSFGELQRMYHQHLVTQSMVEPQFQGTVWDDKPAPNMDPRMLGQGLTEAEGRKLFGHLAGKYVTPEVREALTETAGPVVNSFAHETMKGFVNVFRASKVLTSPTTIARNFLGNFMYQMAAGVPMHRWPLLFTRAVRALSDHGKSGFETDAGSQLGMGKWVQMAVEDGALRPGRGYDVQGSELRFLTKHVIDRPDAGYFKPAFDLYNKGLNKLGGAYSLMDDVHRLMGYMHTVETGKAMGMEDAAARARASSIVNRYYASGASIGPAFRKAGNLGAGVVNPFMSFQVDNARVFKNVIEDAVKGNPGPLIRVAAASGGIYAIAAGLRSLYGVSDNDVRSASMARVPYMTENNPFPLYLPFRNENGYLYTANTEALNPFYMYLKGSGDPTDPKNLAARIATNLALGMVNSGMAGAPVRNIMKGLGAPATTSFDENVLPSQEGVAALSGVWETMKPTLFKQFMDTMRKAQLSGQLRPSEERLSPMEATTKLPMGLWDVAGMEKLGTRTLDAATRALNAQRSDLDKQGKRAVKALQSGEIDQPTYEQNQRLINERKGKLVKPRAGK